MTLIISNNPQGTPEWLKDRLGRATGSKASAIVSKGRAKGSDSVVRRDYMFQLALERVTEKSVEVEFSNRHTDRGNELEKWARMKYEGETGNMVEQIGFCYPEGEMYGCSVDGLIDDDGIPEIKCPIMPIHYSYIEANKVPKTYVPQILHNLFTTKRKYCDFVSYNEDMPKKLQLFVIRFEPTKDQLENYAEELFKFLDEVKVQEQNILERLK